MIKVRKYDPYTGIPEDEDGNTPKFTFFGERCKDLDYIREGMLVNISFEIAGREYMKEGKPEYFTEVRPLRVSPQSPSGMPADYAKPNYLEEAVKSSGIQGYEGEPTPAAEVLSKDAVSEKDDDLPF